MELPPRGLKEHIAGFAAGALLAELALGFVTRFWVRPWWFRPKLQLFLGVFIFAIVAMLGAREDLSRSVPPLRTWHFSALSGVAYIIGCYSIWYFFPQYPWRGLGGALVAMIPALSAYAVTR